MARIAGIDLPREKRIEIALTYIYGIGRTSANKILAEAGVDPAEAFEALYYGWKHAEQRRSGRKVTYFDLMWRRGWLTESDALRLCDYCITGWKPAFE